MATLVTGGTGFVGVNIVKDLARAGHQVVCFDLNGPDRLVQDFVREASSRITFVQGDVLDREAVAGLSGAHAIDKIVHAAVFTVNRIELETARSKDIVDINIAGTANLLELARLQKVSRFLYISSGAVYGDAHPGDQTLNEDDPPAPQNLYGITKYASELLTRRYGQLHHISTASLRLSTPYGPMERVTGHRGVMSVFYHWLENVAKGEAIEADDLRLGRDYTYVADIAGGIRAVLDAPSLPHDLYNITAGEWLTYKDILEALKALEPAVTITEATGAAGADNQSLDRATLRGPLSGHRLFHDLGWTPAYDLASGLAEYLAWRRSIAAPTPAIPG